MGTTHQCRVEKYNYEVAAKVERSENAVIGRRQMVCLLQAFGTACREVEWQHEGDGQTNRDDRRHDREPGELRICPKHRITFLGERQTALKSSHGDIV